jgi:hypothetical protein
MLRAKIVIWNLVVLGKKWNFSLCLTISKLWELKTFFDDAMAMDVTVGGLEQGCKRKWEQEEKNLREKNSNSTKSFFKFL